eukprot:CAMPEP_0114981768 /NCGR_PEP_ID=MMETSP0216-20121206/5719_1 /TAXON_ID=223996 /ORGANISM="Protocruzia adherens, Strain Boccale" /LENGTH=38 /DNA_ID= /DNA_START= /DNA_END= /DNA_ORIENTATION=
MAKEVGMGIQSSSSTLSSMRSLNGDGFEAAILSAERNP